MDVRGIVLFGSLVGASLVAGLSSSCSAPDPGFIEYRERSAITPGASSTGGPAPADGGGSSSGDGGGSSSGAPDPVFGTTAFVAGAAPPPGRANPQGGNNHNGNVVDMDCMTAACHAGAGPSWAFGGSVHVAANGGAPVVGAEVRVSRPDGTEYAKTYTDQDGNFWIDQPAAGPIPANSRVGVRNATTKQIMTGVVAGPTGAACSSGGCHGNAMMRVFL